MTGRSSENKETSVYNLLCILFIEKEKVSQIIITFVLKTQRIKYKMAKITVKDTEINVVKVNDEDYICLTDMLRAKDGDFFITDRKSTRLNSSHRT